jgi:putative nucleotidyltransferase with HDIG domain
MPMSPCETPAGRPTGRHRSLEDQARALAVVLREEFGAPFTFYDVTTGAPVRTGLEGPEADLQGMGSAGLERLAASGRAQVTPLSGGRYRLALLLHQAGRPAVVALGTVGALARSAPDGGREQVMLEKWAQAVGDRLRLADELAAAPRPEERPAAPAASALPWEVLLTVDELARRLRFHRDPGKSYRRILKAAAGFLGAQMLAWVPRHADAAVVTEGETCLAAADSRELAALLARGQDPRRPGPVLIDAFQERSGAGRFPRVHNLLALPVSDPGLVGWVIAINKHASPGADVAESAVAAVPFRKSDAAVLAPFAGLLELYTRGTSRYQELKDLLVGLTRALTGAIDAKDSYTFGHSERVARIAVELARELGLQGDDQGDVYLAGLLHDIGKIGVRDDVLRKPGKLSPEEEDHIRQHVAIGYSILSDLRQLRSILPGVLYHHERYDGAGYPDGLAGDNIPMLARILAVADAYDAMTTARPYRDPLPWNTVERILAQGSGTQWDERVVEAFLRCRHKIHTIRQRGVGESLRTALEGALRCDDHSVRSILPPEPATQE